MTQRTASRLRSSAVSAALLTLALVGLSGCTSIIGTEPTSQPQSSSIDPSRAAENDARLRALACQDDPGSNFAAVSDVDLSKYTWTMPQGFKSSTSYYQEDPVEGDYSDEWAIPVNQVAMLDVIGSALYPQLTHGPLVNKCSQLDVQAAKDRLVIYHDILKATVVEPAQQTEVGGLPALRETIKFKERGYTWDSIWIFGQNQLLHISCQWVKQESDIRRGCQDLLDSLQFTK